MHKILETVGLVVLVITMLAVLFTTALRALDRMELQDCYKWQDYEKLYTLYETHPDTAQRCLALGVDVHEDY